MRRLVDGGRRIRGELAAEEACAFDAVVLDVMLPGMDGFAVARAMRAAQNYTPVLMLTARGRPEDVLEGFAAGADDYLPKPFELSILLARLNGLLRRTQWLQPRTAEAPTQAEDEYTFAGGPSTSHCWSCAPRTNRCA